MYKGSKYELLPGGYDMKEKMRTIGYLCPTSTKPEIKKRSHYDLTASDTIIQYDFF